MKPAKIPQICLLVIGLMGLGWAAGATDLPPDSATITLDSHRFLFLVETSSGNSKFENANRQAVFDLVVKGINGQMRTGDTFGLWTFSDEVRAGEFPMTIWDEAHSLELAGRVAGFLQKQKYAKTTNIKPLITDLRRLADRVGDFDAFIISSGHHEMVGTPFDEAIHNAYEAFAKVSSRTGKPLITTFVVRRAKVSRAGVVLAGDTINNLPERPPPVAKVAKTTAPNSATNGIAATPAAVTTTQSSASTTASTVPTAPNTSTPAPPRKKVMQIVTKPATATETSPSDNSASVAATNAIASATTTTTTLTAQPANLVQASAAVATSTIVPRPESTTSNSLVSTTTPPTATPTKTIGNTSPSQNPSNPANASSAPASPAPGLLTTVASALEPSPLPVAAREISESAAAASSPSENFAPTPTLAHVTPPHSPSGLSAGLLLAIGGILLAATGWLTYVVVRRQVAPVSGRGSIISQSMRGDWRD